MEIRSKGKKRCCFSGKIQTETSVPSYVSCPVLLPSAMKTRGGEGSEFIYNFGTKDKNKWLEVRGSSLQLSEFLNTNRVNGETVMHPFYPLVNPLVYHRCWIFVSKVPACCRNQGTESLQAAHRSGDFISWVI